MMLQHHPHSYRCNGLVVHRVPPGNHGVLRDACASAWKPGPLCHCLEMVTQSWCGTCHFVAPSGAAGARDAGCEQLCFPARGSAPVPL